MSCYYIKCVISFARHKAGGSNAESILVSQLQHGLTLEFENSDPLRRLRLTLGELLAIMNKVVTSCLTLGAVRGCSRDVWST